MIDGCRLCTCRRPVSDCASCEPTIKIGSWYGTPLKTRILYHGSNCVYISFLLRYSKYWIRGNWYYSDYEEHSVDEWYNVDLLELLEILEKDRLYINDETLTEDNPRITRLATRDSYHETSIERVLTYNQKCMLVIESSRIFDKDRLWSSARFAIDLTDIYSELNDFYRELNNTLFVWHYSKCEEIQWADSNRTSSSSMYPMFSSNFNTAEYYYCRPKTVLAYYTLKIRTMWDVFKLLMQNSTIVDEVKYEDFTMDKEGILIPDYTVSGLLYKRTEHRITEEEDVESVIERLKNHVESHSRT